MNSFAFWQACEGALAALWRSAVRRASSTYRSVSIALGLALVCGSFYFGLKFLPIGTADLFGYAAILFVIGLIIYLSNREIRTSLDQTRASERLLEIERNALESHIAKRTQQLITTEKERLFELKRTAQFGELSRGLFHDLMNPLSSIALYVEQLKQTPNHPIENQALIKRTVDVSERMRSFMDSVRRCLGEQNADKKTANVRDEFITVRDVLAYKARQSGVIIELEECDPVTLAIHPVRIYQLFLNLIGNAIDACEASKADERTVTMSIRDRDNQLTIQVHDNGCGMSAEVLDSLFSKSHSSKKNGLGIGLLTVHSIVTEELKGSISVESKDGSGTRFTIVIPLPVN